MGALSRDVTMTRPFHVHSREFVEIPWKSKSLLLTKRLKMERKPANKYIVIENYMIFFFLTSKFSDLLFQ